MLRRFLPKYLFALACTFYLFLVGWVQARHRYLIFQIASHFGFVADEHKRNLPEVDVSVFLPGTFSPNLLELTASPGNITSIELLILTEYTRRRKPSVVFEIGTFDGRTSLNLAANCPNSAMVLTLDLPKEKASTTRFELAGGEIEFVEKDQSGTRYLGTHYEKMIRQLFGDSATFDFSPYYGTADIVFVDGSHAYEYVKSDSQEAMRLLKQTGGIIFWHDFQPDWPGVIRALNEQLNNEPKMSGLRTIRGTTLAYLETGSFIS